MYHPSDLIVRNHSLTTSHDSGYYSSSTTTASMPSLVSVARSSIVSELSPKKLSTASPGTSETNIDPTVTSEDLIARRTITWAPLPENPCRLASTTIKEQQKPSKTQYQSQPKPVNHDHSKTIKATPTSKTKTRTPAKTTSKQQRMPTTPQHQSRFIAEARGRSRTVTTTPESRAKAPSRAERNAWKEPVPTKPQRERQSNLTALIQGSTSILSAPKVAKNGVLRTWPEISESPTNSIADTNDWIETDDDGVYTVTTTATSSTIDISLDPWGQPNHHLAATKTWKDECGTVFLSDGTKAAMTVNSFGEEIPVEIATWGDYWGNHSLRNEEVEDWNRDFRIW